MAADRMMIMRKVTVRFEKVNITRVQTLIGVRSTITVKVGERRTTRGVLRIIIEATSSGSRRRNRTE